METVETINQRLIEYFGLDTLSGLPIWRIVFSEDQFEKRLGTYDDYSSSGIYIRTVREVREVPKYRQWIHEKHVLERLVIVPEINQADLPESKISYEPIWVFEDKAGKPLPPKWEAAKFVIDAVYAAQGKRSLAKYADTEQDNEEIRNQRINELQSELFGNESRVTDALAHGYGIVVPSIKES